MVWLEGQGIEAVHKMTSHKIASAKITRPTPSEAVQRERLFTLLDDSRAESILWVSAPGGAGKSTLVASYLDARELACIWYQCDEGDADLATFFYYMGLAAKKAAPRYKKQLPLLTPEYLAGVPAFTRRYFELLCSRVKTIIHERDRDGQSGRRIVPAPPCQRNLGNHADSVKTYHRCRSLLQTELGIAPSPETTAVYSSINAAAVTHHFTPAE